MQKQKPAEVQGHAGARGFSAPTRLPVALADGNDRGRHPPQERPRPSRGTGRAAARTLYSAETAVCVTPLSVTG